MSGLTTECITRCSKCGKVLRSAGDWSKCRSEHSLDAFRRDVGDKKYAEYVDWFNTFIKPVNPNDHLDVGAQCR